MFGRDEKQVSENTKFPGWPVNMEQSREIVIDKISDEDYIKLVKEQKEKFDTINTQIESYARKRIECVDNAVKEMLIKHGYEKQLDKALNGKTKTMRTRNLNILRKLISIKDTPGRIKQVAPNGWAGTFDFIIIWHGKDDAK